MCGIGGAFLWTDKKPDIFALSRMSDAMQDRGPDDHGIYIDQGIGLVHRRLSIIDLSSAGRNPLGSNDGTIQLVQNGEIYNYKEIKCDLEKRGHIFRTKCDSEVIIHGYSEWGSSITERLEGMFAFAIWDSRNRSILLARDRMGQKPLFIYRQSDGIVFASTLIAINAYFNFELDINLSAVDCFLSHVYIPGIHTAWKGIESLPPANLIKINEFGKIFQHKYWDLKSDNPIRCSVFEAEDIVANEIEDSVKKQLVADVPIGGFLSGGVDSSLIMALAAKHHRNIKTFSIGFDEIKYSELKYAKQVSEAIGSEHNEFIVNERQLLAVLPELVWQYGQPFADASAIPTYLLSLNTRKSVKVALSGDGGDEAFAGYWRAAAGWYTNIYARIFPKHIRYAYIPQIVSLLRQTSVNKFAQRLTSLNSLSLSNTGEGYTNALSWFNFRDILYSSYMKDIVNNRDFHNPISCRTGFPIKGEMPTYLQRILYDDYMKLLPDCYLTKVDVASMAASLEVRSPFLHHPFIEKVWHLPDEMKLRYGKRKWLLKRIAAKYVPKNVIYRRKMGFALPVDEWMKNRLGNVLKFLMIDSRCVKWNWINIQPVTEFIDQHIRGTANHDVRLWTILWLELWARIVVERSMERNISLLDI